MRPDILPLAKQDFSKASPRDFDIILVTGDAYVDHPSYGTAVIGRFLENAGYRVGIIAQPGWKDAEEFKALGRPRLFFGITSGNVDSMVANYTSSKVPRVTDDYSPVGKRKVRPDRALIVYSNRIREAYKDIPIILGGMEASLRRLAHYDYWGDCVRRSVLVDSKADVIVYGMGEKPTLEIADYLNKGGDIKALDHVRGTVICRKDYKFLKECEVIPSYEKSRSDAAAFNKAFRMMYENMNPFTAKPLAQAHGDRFVIQLPPSLPLNEKEMDSIYDLPYTRTWHPVYDKDGGVRGLETVRYSIISHRGCPAECSFCSLYAHQGRIVQSRSPESIYREAKRVSRMDNFKGTITDIGGPTANMYKASCRLWGNKGFCSDKKCMMPVKCGMLQIDYNANIDLLNKIKRLPGVRNVFIGSGFRYDLLIGKDSEKYLEEIMRYHISGRMKVAPEHVSADVLKIMNKPLLKLYEKFVERFNHINKHLERKCFLVNYFISAHPGSSLKEALELSLYLMKKGVHPEQIQDFMPLPMTLAGCIYHTGVHPLTGEKIATVKTAKERRMHRALMQYKNKGNRNFIKEALRELKREDLGQKFRVHC